MSVNRRDLFRVAGAGVGAWMFGVGATQAAIAVPKFVPPTAKSPLALCFNENSLGMSPSAKAAAQASLAQASRYPFARAEALRKACAKFMGGKPENIMLTHGSAESIRAAIESHIVPNTQVVVPELTYSDGEDTARKNKLKVVKVPMGPKWSIDIEGMKKAVAAHNGFSIVYFVNPNNPTSTIVSSKALNDWIKSKPANTFFVVDEAYAEFVEDKSFVSTKTLVDAGYDNLCVLKTFSKIFAMAGMRIGFTYAVPAVVKQCRTQVAYDVMLNIAGIEAALAELNDKEFLELSRKENDAARKVTYAALDELKLEYLPSQTNFVFVNLKSDLKTFADRMKAKNILVGRPFPPATQWCRISLGTVAEMKYFVAVLKDFRKAGWI